VSLGWVLYYVASVILWLGLTILAVGALFPGFVRWLSAHPQGMVLLLGVNRLPENAERILRRFYLYLDIGWTWLLVWSWWLMPWFKNFFYHNVNSERAFQVARYSTLIVLVAYSVFGFFCIGRAISIWFKQIYNRSGV